MVVLVLAVLFAVVGVVWAFVAIRSRNWLQVAQIGLGLPGVELSYAGIGLRNPLLQWVAGAAVIAGAVVYFLIDRRVKRSVAKASE